MALRHPNLALLAPWLHQLDDGLWSSDALQRPLDAVVQTLCLDSKLDSWSKSLATNWIAADLDPDSSYKLNLGPLVRCSISYFFSVSFLVNRHRYDRVIEHRVSLSFDRFL